MDIHARIVSSITILLALIALALLLKRIGLVAEHHGEVFSKLITRITLPALILFSLARTEVLVTEIELALIFAAATVVCLGGGWLAARLLELDRARTGAVILAAGFGNSSMLGFALVSEVFPSNVDALTEAAVLSSLGAQPLIFTFGALIAMYYGAVEPTPGGRMAHTLGYFRSPIFLAFAGGIGLSALFGPMANPVYASILDGVHVVGAANTFLVVMSVGLMLEPRGMRDVLPVVCLVAAIKLLLMPLLAWLPTAGMSLPAWQMEVLVLEASMPCGLLAVVIASAYGCDARLASRLVVATTAIAAVSVPLVFGLLS